MQSPPETKPTARQTVSRRRQEFPVPAGSVRSAIEGLAWPGLPGGTQLSLLTLQFQFEQTQWWPPERLLGHQLSQLEVLLRHAGETVPYYRELFRRIGFDPRQRLTIEDWRRLPILTRRELQDHYAELRSVAPPAGHGAVHESSSSGSTGTPVKVLKTGLQMLFWQAGTLREHLWHRRDLTLRLATIRNPNDRMAALYPAGVTSRNWGSSTAGFATGPGFMLNLSTPIDQQVEWLRRVAPDYLLSYPSNFEALAKHCLDRRIRFGNLRDLRTISEALQPEVRDVCREAFGVEIKDIYSAEEVGNIAFQSPASEQLLAQAETAMVEIVDDAGKPCGPGGLGTVLVTPLHGFALPLIRYAIGDYAEAGDKAACGRGLPVINRVLGRMRNMVRLPNGQLFYPNYAYLMKDMDKVVQFQIARRAATQLELRLVVRAPLTPDEQRVLRARIQERFGYPFDVDFAYRDLIPRAPSGKFLDFVSEIDDGAPAQEFGNAGGS